MAEISAKNGLNRCPHCGGSDIVTDTKEGKLRCKSCKTLFDAKRKNTAGGVENLKGEIRGSGAEDIIPGGDIVLTFKCPACGAEVVINTKEETSASCHWCRHIFSANEKIPNGAVPDYVLPFKMTKEEAIKKVKASFDIKNDKISEDFRKAFDPETITGVYFPYMIVDVKAHSTMNGVTERRSKENEEKNPPYFVYKEHISLEFDVLVDDLTVESSTGRLNQDTEINSNNIINAIMPFDTEEAVAWNANYLRGFTSEKRNVNVNALKEVVALQCGDIARTKATEEAVDSKRGVNWQREHLGIKGTKWKTAYLPVWLYSYRAENDARIYYIAVNARTGETVGCVPTRDKSGLNILERHHHENETRVEIKNMNKKTRRISPKYLTFSKEVKGRNDQRVIGSLSHGGEEMLDVERQRFELARRARERHYAQMTAHNKRVDFAGQIFGFIAMVVSMFIVLQSTINKPVNYGPQKAIDQVARQEAKKKRSSSSSSSSSRDYGGSSSSGGSSGGSSSSGSSGGFDYSYDY